jgi:predicted nucleic acid-binding protein
LIVYLDTSSLIKLYVEEEGSVATRALVASAAVVATCVLAYPEARSALARLRREGGLTGVEQARAKGDLDRDWGGFLALPVDAVWRQAGDLAERHHGLRGADSIHLASYLSLIGRQEGLPVLFSSFDERLNLAARREAGEG